MEATKVKQHRPAYRPMWEQAEREIHALRSLLHGVEEKAVEYARKLSHAESDLLTQGAALHRWGTVAVIEAVALLGLGVGLWLAR